MLIRELTHSYKRATRPHKYHSIQYTYCKQPTWDRSYSQLITIIIPPSFEVIAARPFSSLTILVASAFVDYSPGRIYQIEGERLEV